MATELLDANQVIKKVYDPPTESLNVNATVVAQDITLVVDINQADDSILVYGKDATAVNRPINVDTDGSVFTKTLNNIIQKKYDTIQVTSKNANGPTGLVYRNGGLSGSIVAVGTITYDIDGDFQSFEVVQ